MTTTSINDTCSCGSAFNISGYSGITVAQHAKWLDAHAACRLRLTAEQKSDSTLPADGVAAGIDRRPHSLTCGILPHFHGWSCSRDCPTCEGREEPESASFVEDPLTSHEATKRVLYRVVHSYQVWRDANQIPNELTDDAVRVGEQHLRLLDWFPENEGWLK